MDNENRNNAAGMKLLADEKRGMRVSLMGLVARIDRGRRFTLDEMIVNLNEMASRYYSGDVTAVDEFLQLYCIGEEARKQREAVEARENEEFDDAESSDAVTGAGDL